MSTGKTKEYMLTIRQQTFLTKQIFLFTNKKFRVIPYLHMLIPRKYNQEILSLLNTWTKEGRCSMCFYKPICLESVPATSPQPYPQAIKILGTSPPSARVGWLCGAASQDRFSLGASGKKRMIIRGKCPFAILLGVSRAPGLLVWYRKYEFVRK